MLSSLILKKEREGLWKGAKVCKNVKSISHLLSADDSIIFFEYAEKGLECVKNVLQTYELWSGQRINFEKLNLILSPSTTDQEKSNIARSLNVNYTERVGKYLGSWIDPQRNKNHIYQHMTDSVLKRINP